MLMIEELLNISPEFREWFRKEPMPRRVSIKEMEKERKVTMNTKIQIEEPVKKAGEGNTLNTYQFGPQ